MTTRMLAVTQPLTLDNFPAWAKQFVATLELELIEQEQGADYYQWRVCFEGTQLFLCFQHYADCAWLEPLRREEQTVADWLAAQWQTKLLVE